MSARVCEAERGEAQSSGLGDDKTLHGGGKAAVDCAANYIGDYSMMNNNHDIMCDINQYIT
jgi:hypothetical protein